MSDSPWTFGEESERVAGGLTLVEGTSFAICDQSGDIHGRGVDGVYVADTRICSRLVVLLDGRPVEPLAAHLDQPFAARFVGRSADRTLLVRRAMWVGRGLRLDVELSDRTGDGRRVDVAVAVAADLGHVFAVKEGRAPGTVAPVSRRDGGLSLGDPAGGRAAFVRSGPCSTPPTVDEDGSALRWRADIPPGGTWTCCVEVVAVRAGEIVEPRHGCAAQVPSSLPEAPASSWQGQLPTVSSDVAGLERAVARAGVDLSALRIHDPDHPDDAVIAAGAPWFMTLFGRDSILTSIMALPLDPRLGLATARSLARLQGRRVDPETEEQPGRIVHELRSGPGASLALAAAVRYYGTADATPLFVLLVHELWRWGVPWSDIEPLLPAVDAALGWLADHGDRDGDGFVEYQRMTERGLLNQGWKDSWDAISFADGRLAEAPIALAEVQAYAYAAWCAGAELATAAHDHVAAASRRSRAQDLEDRFDDAFWVPDRGWYAIALDGAGRQVDSLASNLGHLLWCGIVPPARRPAVAELLTSPELASGWGLRTLATTMRRYDPLGYHTGSVWPHDTAIAIAGLRRAGCVDEALVLASQLLAAAEASGGRLPELFAGLGPGDLAVPVPYPASCSPQAWASAAPVLVLRALLGLEPQVPHGRIDLDPLLPPGASRLSVRGMPLAGARVDVDVDGDSVAVRGLPSHLAVVRPAA